VWKVNSGPLARLPLPPGTIFASTTCENQFGKYIFVGGAGGLVYMFSIPELWATVSAQNTPRVPLTPIITPTPPPGQKATSRTAAETRNVLPDTIRNSLPVLSARQKPLVGAGRQLASGLVTFNHGPYIVICTTAGVDIWDYEKGVVVENLGPEKHATAIYGVAVSPDDSTIVTASFDKQIWIWRRFDDKNSWPDQPTGSVSRYKRIHSLMAHDSLRQVAFSPDGRRFALASNLPEATCVYFITGVQDFVIPGPTKVVNEVIFSSDGKRIYSACCDHKIRVTDVESKETIGEIGAGHTVFKLGLVANDQLLVATLSDHTVAIFATTPSLVLLRKAEFSTFSEYSLTVLNRPVK